MDVLVERCAGDRHRQGRGGGLRADTRCRAGGAAARRPGRSRRSPATLEAMADWFTAEGVTEVAMEATGSYWKPVWYVLEERAFELKLVNAQHVKILPGRKSDVLDAEWLAELLEHGLLRGSFVPPAGDPGAAGPDPLPQAAHPGPHRGVPADPEDPGGRRHQAGLGRLRRARACRAGRCWPRWSPANVTPRCSPSWPRAGCARRSPSCARRCAGRFRDHHALLIGLCLDHTAHLEAAIARLDDRVDALFAANTSEAGVPFVRARDRLDTITGVGKRAAETIIAEIGVDMSRFPTAGHLASWAGMAPGNNITGGKRGSGKTTKGDVWLDRHPHPVRLGRRPHPRHLPVGPVLAARPPDRQEEGRRRRRPLHPRHLLAPAHQRLPTTTTSAATTSPARNTDRQRDRLIQQLHDLGYTVTLDKIA